MKVYKSISDGCTYMNITKQEVEILKVYLRKHKYLNKADERCIEVTIEAFKTLTRLQIISPNNPKRDISLKIKAAIDNAIHNYNLIKTAENLINIQTHSA